MPSLADLEILYAGDAGTPRTAAFVALLDEHARSVRAVGRSEIAPGDLDGVDVLVIDGDPHGPRPSLTLHDVTIPTVLIGGAGGRVADDFGLKLGWEYG